MNRRVPISRIIDHYGPWARSYYARGLEAAQLVLGHSSALVTEAVYAERDAAIVQRIMSEMG